MFHHFIHKLKNNLKKPSPKGPSFSELLQNKSQTFLEFLLYDSEKMMRKYGGIIRLAKKQYIITDPNAFKYILKTNPQNFTKQNMTYNRIKLIFGDGLIVSEGKIWEQHRTLIQPLFERSKMEQYATFITHCTKDMLNKWQLQNSSQVDILKEMNNLMLRIAFLSFCSHEPSFKEREAINFALKWGNRHISYALLPSKWMLTPNNLIFFWALNKMDSVIKNIIEHRRQHPIIINDLIHTLLTAQKNQDIPLSDSEILDEVKTLLLTGHETTACGLTSALYLLTKYPDYRVLLEEELSAVLGDRIPTFEDCNHLPFTKAVFLEALRLYPTIWCLPRKTLKKDSICGFDIPANSQLILNIYALHRNPEFWEEPNKFYPHRFLEDNPNKRHIFSYLPFSVGPHSCIGIHFAIMEGILSLAMMCRTFRFNLIDKNKAYKPKPLISLRPPKGFKLRIDKY